MNQKSASIEYSIPYTPRFVNLLAKNWTHHRRKYVYDVSNFLCIWFSGIGFAKLMLRLKWLLGNLEMMASRLEMIATQSWNAPCALNEIPMNLPLPCLWKRWGVFWFCRSCFSELCIVLRWLYSFWKITQANIRFHSILWVQFAFLR